MAVPQEKAQFVKVLIDTNVVLDATLQRAPYVVDSANVMFLAQAKRFRGYVSASAISDIYYILRKEFGHAKSMDALRRLVTFCKISRVDTDAIEAALISDFEDFEDAIQNCAAIANGLDTIVTRNAKDFVRSPLQILTPAQLVQSLS